MIAFIPFEGSHIPHMRKWLCGGEALRWYGDDAKTEEALRCKYLIEKPRGGTHSFVVAYEGQLIGHIQYYRAIDYPEWCSLVSGQPHDYGLDLFIGRGDLIGRGVGTRLV